MIDLHFYCIYLPGNFCGKDKGDTVILICNLSIGNLIIHHFLQEVPKNKTGKIQKNLWEQNWKRKINCKIIEKFVGCYEYFSVFSNLGVSSLYSARSQTGEKSKFFKVLWLETLCSTLCVCKHCLTWNWYTCTCIYIPLVFLWKPWKLTHRYWTFLPSQKINKRNGSLCDI